MPDWIDYTYYRGTSTNIEPFYTSLTPLTDEQIQAQYEEYQREQEQNLRSVERMWVEHQQRMEKEFKQEKQLQEDKENYPLLFLKEGIV